MLAAEKWYEYQTSYHKYGLDMKPEEPKRKKKKKPAPSPVRVTAADKLRMIVLTMFIGSLCGCLILTTAYTAMVRHDTNNVLRRSSELQGEIENLNVEIKSQNNIKTIEKKAKDMGMVYPGVAQYVTVCETETPGDLAFSIKQQAFEEEI